MKAKVRKTGEIVTLVDKREDYYIDNLNSPYKEEELEFGVIDNDIPTDPMLAMAKIMSGNSKQFLLSPALQLATEVLKVRPSIEAEDLANYVATVIDRVNNVL